MSTDFPRLFRNTDYNLERGSGTTYTGLYQAFGHCLGGGKVSIILCDTARHVHYLKREIFDMMGSLGISMVRGEWTHKNLPMSKDGHEFEFLIVTQQRDLYGLPRDSFVFQETEMTEEILHLAKQRFPKFRQSMVSDYQSYRLPVLQAGMF